MRTDIAHLFSETHQIFPPAHIEGGDILITGTEILVGTSDRTNAAGVEALTRIAANWGYHVRTVNTPPGVLQSLVEEKRRVLTLARESIRRLAVIDSVAW